MLLRNTKFGTEKPEISPYCVCEKYVDILNCFSTNPGCDGRTDGQTDSEAESSVAIAGVLTELTIR